MLTKKQRELLLFINDRIKETGVSPSFDEMKEALDLASKSGIHRLITALEERGFLRRLAHRARALEVLKLPESAVPQGSGRAPFRPRVVNGEGRGRTGRQRHHSRTERRQTHQRSPQSVNVPDPARSKRERQLTIS